MANICLQGMWEDVKLGHVQVPCGIDTAHILSSGTENLLAELDLAIEKLPLGSVSAMSDHGMALPLSMFIRP